MSTLTENNKATPELQAELAAYGIMRETAIEEAPKYSGPGPEYFGLEEQNDEFKMLFTSDLTDLDKHEKMHMAIVAPEFQTFDMLAPKDYSKHLSFKDPVNLRSYLRRLVDEC